VSQKRRLCQLTSVVPCSLFSVSWPWKLGPIGWPKTSVWNYQFTLRNVSGLRRSDTIWWCRPWFGSTSGSEQSRLARSGLVLHMRIWDDLTYLNAKFKEIIWSCIWVNTLITPSLYLYSDVVAVFDTCKERQVEIWYVFCLKNAFTNNMCVKCEVGLYVPCFPEYNTELALWTVPEQEQHGCGFGDCYNIYALHAVIFYKHNFILCSIYRILIMKGKT